MMGALRARAEDRSDQGVRGNLKTCCSPPRRPARTMGLDPGHPHGFAVKNSDNVMVIIIWGTSGRHRWFWFCWCFSSLALRLA